jgi:hypothetical protein
MKHKMVRTLASNVLFTNGTNLSLSAARTRLRTRARGIGRDLGFKEGKFILPELRIHDVAVQIHNAV